MPAVLLFAALVLAVLDWIAVARAWRPLEYLAKPGVMAALLAWLWLTSGFSGYLVWFAVGLAFSMVGDIFLMLPRQQFIAGLAAFLLAHVAYLIGFNTTLPPLTFASLIPVLLVGAVGGQLYRSIAAGLKARGRGKLAGPVLVYSIVISLMLISALLTLLARREEWNIAPALLVSAGALFFFLSDSLLAWDKFVAPLFYGRLKTHVTYHLGQALIVIGAAAQFLGYF